MSRKPSSFVITEEASLTLGTTIVHIEVEAEALPKGRDTLKRVLQIATTAATLYLELGPSQETLKAPIELASAATLSLGEAWIDLCFVVTAIHPIPVTELVGLLEVVLASCKPSMLLALDPDAVPPLPAWQDDAGENSTPVFKIQDAEQQ